MRKSKIEGADERTILTAMITSESVLGKISLKWDGKLFRSAWSNQVGKMCLDYYSKHTKAPENHIEVLFRQWAKKRSEDDKQVDIIGRFLSGLSDDYEAAGAINPDFVVDLAAKHFNRVRYERLRDEIEERLEGDDVDGCDKLLGDFHRLELGMGSFIDVMSDDAAIDSAFTNARQPLFNYQGALGHFMGDAMARDSFVAFTGPEKRGKTFWLMDTAWRALRDRNRVVFFAVGDMSQDQMMERFIIRAAGRPLRAGSYTRPTAIMRSKDAEHATTVKSKRKVKYDLRSSRAGQVMKKWQKKLRSKDSFLKLSCWPNDSINVDGLRSELDVLDRDGWTADVIVIDYADILAPPSGERDYRQQQNKTWQQLRALSQERHALVVTATQSDAKSYSSKVLSRTNFSEDKRKQAHVTGIIGLNQMAAEKEEGVMRLNWVVRREANFSENSCVNVAGCLGIANPSMYSCY